MKIKVDIDCTPEEARTFFGLPDLTPLHDTMIAATQERMKAALNSTDAEALLKAWLPMSAQMGAQGLEAVQKFWSGAMAAAASGSGGGDKSNR